MEAYIHGVSMTMCNIIIFQCVSMWVFKMGFNLGIGKTC
jgi:hypothetical protein